MIGYIQHIIVPYVTKMRAQLKLSTDHPALVIFDVFQGQCVESNFQMLEENNILYVIVPANCTDKLQPLDLSVNKPAKDYMKQRFQEWYGGIICQQLEDKVEEAVDMRMSIMKPLASQWIIDMYDYFQSKPAITINGYREAGIVDILKD